MEFECLPRDMQIYLLDFLLPEEMAAVAQVSRTLATLVESDFLWMRKFYKHFPHLLPDIRVTSQTDWRAEFWQAYKEDYSSIFSSAFIYRSHEKKVAKIFSIVKENKSLESQLDALIQPPSFNNLFDTRAYLFQLEEMLDVHGKSPIHWALQVGNRAALHYFYKQMLAHFHYLNYPGKWLNHYFYSYDQYPTKVRMQYFQTLLYWAIVLQPRSHVNVLLQQGASLSEEYRLSKGGYSEFPGFAIIMPFPRIDLKIFYPVHLAAHYGRLDLLKDWLERDPDCLNRLDGMNKTPLHWALNADQEEIAILLLDKGADISCVSLDKNCKPIHLAAAFGLMEPLKKIIKKNPSLIDQQGYFGYTSLHLAINGLKSDAAIELIKAGANLHALAHDGSRKLPANIKPIHAAAMHGLVEVVASIVERDPQMLNELDTARESPLTLAIRYKQFAMVKWLIQSGADLTQEVLYHRHLIHLAAKFGVTELVDLFIQQDKKLVNIEDEINVAPLYLAARYNRLDTAELLIKNGANLNVERVVDDASPLRAAIKYHNDEMVILLLRYGAAKTTISQFNASKKVRILWGLFDYIETREKSTEKYVSRCTFFGRTVTFGQDRENELEAARILRDIIIYGADVEELHVHLRNVVLNDRDLKEIYNHFKDKCEFSNNSEKCPEFFIKGIENCC